MDKLPDIGCLQTGDSVEPGMYACMNCPHIEPDDDAIIYMDKTGILPKCPVCKSPTYWTKI